MLTFLLQGLTLGFAAGAQPGPFQTYLISQTLSQGWRRTWIAAFAPLFSDGPIVALVLLVLSQVPDWFQRVLQIVGGLFVLYLAWSAYKAWQAFAPDSDATPQTGPRSLLRAAMMNALSPGPYLFWSLVIGPLITSVTSSSCLEPCWYAFKVLNKWSQISCAEVSEHLLRLRWMRSNPKGTPLGSRQSVMPSV